MKPLLTVLVSLPRRNWRLGRDGTQIVRSLGWMILSWISVTGVHSVCGQERPGCPATESFRAIWIKVAERTCLKCHVAGGDAADSEFLLSNPLQVPAGDRTAATLRNCEILTKLAALREEDGRAKLLVKATGGLDHGGGQVVKQDSTEYRVLEDFVRSVQETPRQPNTSTLAADEDTRSFWDGVT